MERNFQERCLLTFKIILKVTKNQGFTLSLEDTVFEKPQGGGQIDAPAPAVLGLILLMSAFVSQKISIFWQN